MITASTVMGRKIRLPRTKSEASHDLAMLLSVVPPVRVASSDTSQSGCGRGDVASQSVSSRRRSERQKWSGTSIVSITIAKEKNSVVIQWASARPTPTRSRRMR